MTSDQEHKPLYLKPRGAVDLVPWQEIARECRASSRNWTWLDQPPVS